MKLLLDTNEKKVTFSDENQSDIVMDLYSKEAFELISQIWLKVGWNEKYVYTFSWFDRPVIQLPEDLIRIQEVIFHLKPDVIVEMGVAHGGSLVFYASLLKAMGKGRVIGVDIEIRPHNRTAIEAHFLSEMITLVEGNSVSPEIVAKVKSLIHPDDIVLVILDSLHTKEHVLAELEAFHGLVSTGSYIVATDGIMELVYDTPRGKPDWKENNPSRAALEFLSGHREFVLEQPGWKFNESELDQNITHWPQAWLKRV